MRSSNVTFVFDVRMNICSMFAVSVGLVSPLTCPFIVMLFPRVIELSTVISSRTIIVSPAAALWTAFASVVGVSTDVPVLSPLPLFDTYQVVGSGGAARAVAVIDAAISRLQSNTANVLTLLFKTSPPVTKLGFCIPLFVIAFTSFFCAYVISYLFSSQFNNTTSPGHFLYLCKICDQLRNICCIVPYYSNYFPG